MTTLTELLKLINGYVVGGAVRDIYMGRTPHDYDVITTLTPSEIRNRVPVAHSIGEKYGTLCIETSDCGIVEVTTARSDMTPGRKPEVCWTQDIFEDLKRRDFTINNLFMDATGCIQGFEQSHEDIKNKIIRCVGSPNERLNEDTLRALRAIRFKIQLDFEISYELRTVLHEFDLRIGTSLAGTRVMEELRKMFVNNACESISQLNYYGLLHQIFPEIDMLHQCLENPKWHPDERTTFVHTLNALKRAQNYSFEIQIATALHDIGKAAVRDGDSTSYFGHAHAGKKLIKGIAERLLWSNDLREACEFVCENHMKMHVIEEMRPFKRRELYMSDHFNTLYYAHECDIGGRINSDHMQWILDDMVKLKAQPPLITGHDIIQYHISGPAVGRLKEKCHEAQLRGEFSTYTDGIIYLLDLLSEADSNE